MVASDEPDFVTIVEAARVLRVSPVTVQRWLRHGRLPDYHVGPGAVRIRRTDLEAVIAPLVRDETDTRRQRDHPATALAPLSDAVIAQQEAALAASAEILAQQAARRGGEPFAESWPLIRAARAARSRRQA